MRPIEYYILLHNLHSEVEINRACPVTLEQLSEVFFCSRRNVSNILAKLQAEGWIKWVSGNGRKHRSELTFLKRLDDLIRETVNSYMQEGDLHSVLRFNELIENSSYKHLILERLSDSIGYTQGKQDVLRVPFHRSLTVIDPLFIERRAEIHIASQIFNTLVELDDRKKIILGLAYRWYSNETFTKWRFFLKKDIRFHHGKVLTSEDVKFTLERVSASNSPYKWLTQDIDEIILVDDGVVEIHLKKPNKQLPMFLSSIHLAILPSDRYRQDERNEGLPLGTGPFKLAASHDKITRLEVNKEYFRERAFLDVVEFVILTKNELSLLTDLRNHNMQFSPFQYANKDSSSFGRTNMVETGCSYLLFNDHKCNNHDVRKRIKQILEKEKLNDDSIIPAYSFLPAFSDSRKPEEADDVLTHGSVEAIQLYTYDNAVNSQNALWLKDICEKEGITVELNIVSLEELNQPSTLSQADVVLNRIIFREPLDLDVIDLFRNETSHFRYLLKDELYQRVDGELEIFLSENSCKPEEVLAKIEAELTKQVNLVFISHIEQQIIHDHSLKDLEINDLGWINFHSVWFEDQENSFI
jgi:SgrR family transcriptional regulator